MKQVEVEPPWAIRELKQIIQHERAVRQQAQLAAEQALTAAKEAQRVVLELEQELDSKNQQLDQERKQADAAAQKAAKECQVAVLKLEKELDRKSQQLEKERTAREQAENAARKAVETTGSKDAPQSAKADSDKCSEARPKRETEELNVDDAVHSTSRAVSPNEITEKSSPLKRPHESTEAQSPKASKKPRGPGKARLKTAQAEGSKHKMSLQQARKTAQEEIEMRVEQRAKQLSSKK
ncbi:unnamed protein product [Phytophthora fragariaefolia]|uniref:Unnamed protein product n=1 Tax=Phytophthora fragariaefolia TaxID=1490495 RepID=A0A9W6YEH4_9STRA|nr:unnamed protein product [Phytophthora fragariaefolia]